VSQDRKSIDRTLSNYAVELKAKGLSAVSPDVQGVKWTHTKVTVHNDVKYPVGSSWSVCFDHKTDIVTGDRRRVHHTLRPKAWHDHPCKVLGTRIQSPEEIRSGLELAARLAVAWTAHLV